MWAARWRNGLATFSIEIIDPIKVHDFLIFAGLVLFALMIPVFYRVASGPTALDRIVAVNVIGTKTTVILVIIGSLFGRTEMFIDFALTYALLNFIGSLAVAKYFQNVRRARGREGSAGVFE